MARRQHGGGSLRPIVRRRPVAARRAQDETVRKAHRLPRGYGVAGERGEGLENRKRRLLFRSLGSLQHRSPRGSRWNAGVLEPGPLSATLRASRDALGRGRHGQPGNEAAATLPRCARHVVEAAQDAAGQSDVDALDGIVEE